MSISVVSRCSSHPSPYPWNSSQENDEPTDDGPVEQCIRDEDTCSEFVRRTCGCKKANGGPCSSLFSVDHYVTLRVQAALLTRNELDMVILGSIMSTTLDFTHSIKDGQHKNAKRRKVSSNFMHHGHHVCKVTFGFCMALASIIRYWQLGNTTRKTEWRLALTRTPSISLPELYLLMTSTGY